MKIKLDDVRREYNDLLLVLLIEQLGMGQRFGQALSNLGFDCDRFYEEPWDSYKRIEKLTWEVKK